MGVTVQVRNLDAGVQEPLVRAAEKEGLSLPEFLRRELTALAKHLQVRERARQLNSGKIRNQLGGPFPGLQGIDIQEIVRKTREDRDNR